MVPVTAYRVLAVLLLHLCISENILFKWPESDSRFDCVVAITVNGRPAVSGAWVTYRLVVTSANIIAKHRFRLNAVKVHSRKKNESTEHNVDCIMHQFKRTPNRWIRMGFDNLHTPIHDFSIITVTPTLNYWNYKPETPFPVEIAHSYHFYDQVKPWQFAGFNYADAADVLYAGNELRYTVFDTPSMVDCYEYLPSRWGYFLCFRELDEIAGVPLGGPLFFADAPFGYMVFGVASFTLKKGKDSIVVFTDLTRYTGGKQRIKFCSSSGYLNAWPKERYNETDPASKKVFQDLIFHGTKFDEFAPKTAVEEIQATATPESDNEAILRTLFS